MTPIKGVTSTGPSGRGQGRRNPLGTEPHHFPLWGDPEKAMDWSGNQDHNAKVTIN